MPQPVTPQAATAPTARPLPPLPNYDISKIMPPSMRNAQPGRTIVPQTPSAPTVMTPAQAANKPHQAVMLPEPTPSQANRMAAPPAGFKLPSNYSAQIGKPLTPQAPPTKPYMGPTNPKSKPNQ